MVLARILSVGKPHLLSQQRESCIERCTQRKSSHGAYVSMAPSEAALPLLHPVPLRLFTNSPS